MFSIFAGTFILAFVHALIPNHWLPLVAVARAEQWKIRDVITITFISAAAHVLGTLLWVWCRFYWKRISGKYGDAINIASSVLLIVFGLIYYTVNLPHHHQSEQKDVATYKRSKRKWILIFIVMMFLSPCLEVESLFLSAGAYGMAIVSVMAVIYTIVSVSGILLLVNLGQKGLTFYRQNLLNTMKKE